MERGDADVNKLDFHNYSPLLFAVIWGWLDIVKLLLDKGAKVDQVDVVGETCLMLAVKHNHLDVVEFLVEETDIGINSKNSDGSTALVLAINNENVDICECLLAYDADPNALNYAKKTPLKLACAAQSTEIAHLLLDFKAQRRKSAFEFLKGDALYEIQRRLEKDEKDAREAAEAQMKGKNKGTVMGAGMSSYGAWMPYLDKQKKELFYYNKVSRECQWEEPSDYKKDLLHVVVRATYGMHFYH